MARRNVLAERGCTAFEVAFDARADVNRDVKRWLR
jgi:hypothetical protein